MSTMDAATAEMGPTLLERAQAWREGDIEGLIILGHSISKAYHDLDIDDLDTKAMFRAACDDLLAHEQLPTMYRVQLLIFMAGTEAVGDYDRLRERLKDAEYWVRKLRLEIELSTVSDPRVDGLEETIYNMMDILNEADPPADPDPYVLPTAEEEREDLEYLRRGMRMLEELQAETVEEPQSTDTAETTAAIAGKEPSGSAGEGKGEGEGKIIQGAWRR